LCEPGSVVYDLQYDTNTVRQKLITITVSASRVPWKKWA